MNSLYEQHLETFEKIKNLGADNEHLYFRTSADGVIHGPACAKDDETDSEEEITLAKFLKKPKKYLHKKCYGNMFALGGLLYDVTGTDDRYFIEFVKASENLLNAEKLSEEPAALTFEENIANLRRLEVERAEEYFFNEDTYQAVGMPCNEEEETLKRQSIVKHLMKSEKKEVSIYLLSFFDAHERSSKEKGYFLVRSLSDETLQNGERQEEAEDTWLENGFFTGYLFHEFIIAKNPKGNVYLQLPAKFKEAWASLSVHCYQDPAFFKSRKLDDVELLAFSALAEKHYQQLPGVKAMKEAYKSLSAL